MNSSLLLRVLALVCFIIGAIVAGGDVTNAHAALWVPLGLAFWCASSLAPTPAP